MGGERDQSLSRLSTTGEETQPPGPPQESVLHLPGDWDGPPVCKSLGTCGPSVLSFLWSQRLLDGWTQSRDPVII